MSCSDAVDSRRRAAMRKSIEATRDAALGQGFRHEVVVDAVLVDPSAAMHLQRRRERPGAARPVDARQHRLAALALVFDILDAQFVASIGKRGGRHGFLPGNG